MLEFPGTADGPWRRYIDRSAKFISHEGSDAVDAGLCEMNFELRDQIGTVRYPRIVPRDEDCAKQLKKQTLTNLCNERPTWLDLAHRRLDEAVFADPVEGLVDADVWFEKPFYKRQLWEEAMALGNTGLVLTYLTLDSD